MNETMSERRLVSSGSPYEPVIGFSRGELTETEGDAMRQANLV